MAQLEKDDPVSLRERWRIRLSELSPEDQIKVASLLSMMLPIKGISKHAGVLSSIATGAAGYLPKIVGAWRAMGTPGPLMTKYLGGLARPAAKAWQYSMFPGLPALSLHQGLTGEAGPVSTLYNMVEPMATLPLGIPAMLAGLAGSYFVTPKIDQFLGWKPTEQREQEMFSLGMQQGIRDIQASTTIPPQRELPPPGSFYQPTTAYTPMAAMQSELLGQSLRGNQG